MAGGGGRRRRIDTPGMDQQPSRGENLSFLAMTTMTDVGSIPEVPGEESSVSAPSAPRNLTTASSSRPTFQWPFQSQSINESSSHNHTNSSAQHSRSTSFPARSRRSSGWINLRPASSVLGSDIIPDYVVNFLRGETPETLARKREHEGNPHAPDLNHGGHANASQAADFFSLHSRMGSRGTLEGMLGNGKKGSKARKFMTGWRGGIALNMSLAVVCLLVAIVAVILAATTKRLSGQPETIFEGKCGRARSIDLGLHALINVFAFFFIAAGNYVAQVLASPTRTEVQSAHSKQKWLDIGIPSLRNLAGISKGRGLLCAVIVLAAVSIHVVYNSLLFVKEIDSSTCALTINGPLLGAVAILNLLLVLLLAGALARPSSANPLVTLGDAIASFLMEPDHTTEGACLVTKGDITSGHWGCGEARYWFTQSHRWLQTPSKMRWMVWFVSWLLPTGMAAAMLGMAVVDGPKRAFVGLGDATSTYPLPDSIPRFGQSIVLALPQLLLAGLYFSTNALMTVFYLSHELSRFAIPGIVQALRMSGQPMGSQITSLYLTLPRPLSWLLFVLFVAKAFFLSQSFQLVVTDGPSIGINPLPLVILLGLLLLTLLIILGMSLRRTDMPSTSEDGKRQGNPLALKGGSCSAVISAKCHRSAAEGADVASLPLAWGVVTEGKVGHAAFSSQQVETLLVAKAYA